MTSAFPRCPNTIANIIQCILEVLAMQGSIWKACLEWYLIEPYRASSENGAAPDNQRID